MRAALSALLCYEVSMSVRTVSGRVAHVRAASVSSVLL